MANGMEEEEHFEARISYITGRRVTGPVEAGRLATANGLRPLTEAEVNYYRGLHVPVVVTDNITKPVLDSIYNRYYHSSTPF